MADTLFDERLRRLGQENHGPPLRAAGRDGLGRPSLPPVRAAEADGDRRRSVRNTLPFALGAIWLFTAMQMAKHLGPIQQAIAAHATLSPRQDGVMLVLVLLIAASMLGCLCALAHTLTRFWRRDAGWMLSLGTLAGVIVGVGPGSLLAFAIAETGL